MSPHGAKSRPSVLARAWGERATFGANRELSSGDADWEKTTT
jgi:hypothetical protein